VVGAAAVAVFVMKMVLGELAGALVVVSERICDDTEDAIEEVAAASAEEELSEVSETWLEVLDEVVEVTAKRAMLAGGALIPGRIMLAARAEYIQVEFDMPMTRQSPE